MYTVLAVAFSLFLSVAAEDVVSLDSSNFDRIVMDRNKDVLVKFYAPWCGHCKRIAPVYEKVGTTFKLDRNCVVAKVDADSETDLAKRFNINGYPTLKFFSKDNKAGEEYNQGREESDFIEFLNEKCNLNRVAGGGLGDQAGRISEFDKLAVNFMTNKAARETILQEAEGLLGQQEEKHSKSAKYYVKVMKKVAEKGDDYPTTETARLEKILSGDVSSSKADDMYMRKNILAQFKAEAKSEL